MATRQWGQIQLEVQRPVVLPDRVKLDISQKLLGIQINHNMSWNNHLTSTNAVNARLRLKLGNMWKACKDLTSSTKLKIANGLIVSILTYGMPVWGGDLH